MSLQVIKVLYHPEVERDLKDIPKTMVKRIFKAIEERLLKGKPEEVGKPLQYGLSKFRRLRVGDFRIVYRLENQRLEILVLAIGPRRDDEVYGNALKRVKS